MCSENNGIGVAVYQILMCVTLSHMSIGQGDVSLGGVAHHAAEQGAEGAHQDDGHDDGKAVFDSRKMTFVLHEICNAQKTIHENVFQRFFHFRLLLISLGGWMFGSLFVSLRFVSS